MKIKKEDTMGGVIMYKKGRKVYFKLGHTDYNEMICGKLTGREFSGKKEIRAKDGTYHYQEVEKLKF